MPTNITTKNFGIVAHELKNALDDIARIVFPREDTGLNISATEKNKNDFVTAKDIAIDGMLTGFLEMKFGCPVVSEERAHKWPPRTEQYWVIDPVDGTHNLSAGWPIFGIMGAYIIGDTPTLSFIYFPYAYGM